MTEKYHLECLVCGSPGLKALKGYEKHDLVKCRSCGFVFMRRVPSAEELDAYYSTYSYGREQYLSPLTIKSYNILLDELEKFRTNNRLLDVGCGSGFFLDEAKKRGWEVYGTEYSAKAVEMCRQKGITIKEGMLDPVSFGGKTFDVITSFEVLEHINNPKEELASIHKLLRTGGLFYCTTPNFNSLMRYYLGDKYNVITYPEHLSYYTKSTLNKVVTERGFRPYKFLSTGISLSRLRTSKGSNEELISSGSSDELLRQKIEKKPLLGIAKKIVNSLLTLTNTGLTLKGYYIKK
jgi:2-polyprenyl-3-methyl-5-hydroxy-6-metoxy-1,4-benzoquinol methylase